MEQTETSSSLAAQRPNSTCHDNNVAGPKIMTDVTESITAGIRPAKQPWACPPRAEHLPASYPTPPHSWQPLSWLPNHEKGSRR